MRKSTAGKIRYQIDFVGNPDYQGRPADIFSDALLGKIRRRNVPEWRIVYFDGRRSRREEINVDYGVRSPSIELRSVDRPTIIYCKEFRAFGFCFEFPINLPITGRPPALRLTGEIASIAGLHCRKGEYQGGRHLHVWFTEVEVDDPTGAVLRLEGVSGLIMRTEQIAGPRVDAVERVTVAELSFAPPPAEIFSVPAGYRRVPDVDVARAEDRRALAAKSAQELQRHPLSAAECDMFVGTWLFDSPPDKIVIEIVRAGHNAFRFRTTVPTAPADAVERVRDEKASMQGRTLLVEEPPNYRLYRLGDDGRSLIEVDNHLFTFIRS
jgi:hypothetical protein